MDAAEIALANEHYYKYKEQYNCHSNCLLGATLELSHQFYCRNEVDRINIVGVMLLSLADAPGETNDMLQTPRKRIPGEDETETDDSDGDS